MRLTPNNSTLWFFVWASGTPYVTSVAAHTRRDCIREADKLMGQPWSKTYRQGGRVVRCRVSPCHRKDS